MRGLARTGDILDSAKESWNAALEDFRQKEAMLDDAESSLYSVHEIAQQDDADLIEWNRLYSKINAQKSIIAGVHSALQSAQGWWNSFTSYIPGLSGYRKLGAAQVIVPISVGALLATAAGIAALAASVTGFVAYLSAKQDELIGLGSEVQEMRGAGVSEEKIEQYISSRIETAKDSAKARSGYSFTGDIVRIVALTVAGIAIAIVGPRLLGKK